MGLVVVLTRGNGQSVIDTNQVFVNLIDKLPPPILSDQVIGHRGEDQMEIDYVYFCVRFIWFVCHSFYVLLTSSGFFWAYFWCIWGLGLLCLVQK